MARSGSYSARLILNTALWLTGLGLVVRACGAIKEIIFARAYGVSAETDAFVLANTFATFLPAIFGGALATALIAELAKAKAESKAAIRPLMVWTIAAAAACAILAYGFPGILLPAIFSASAETLEKAIGFSRLLAPLSFAMVMSTALAALLNSSKQFYLPAAAALATPVTMMVAIGLGSDRWGVEAAIFGMVLGAVVEAAVLAFRVFVQRNSVLGRERLSHGLGKSFFKSVAILCIAASVAALFPLVDQFFLSRLETGAVTHFNYASKVNSLLIGVFGTAFGVAIYPYLSDLAAQRDRAGLKRLTGHLAAVVLPAIALASLIVYVFSMEIVQLLFARGNFPQASVAQVGGIQRIFSLQLVFYVAGLLAMRILNATNSTRSVLAVSIIGLGATALFDWLFYRGMGASGIALSAVLTSAVNFGVAIFFVRSALHASR